MSASESISVTVFFLSFFSESVALCASLSLPLSSHLLSSHLSHDYTLHAARAAAGNKLRLSFARLCNSLHQRMRRSVANTKREYSSGVCVITNSLNALVRVGNFAVSQKEDLM